MPLIFHIGLHKTGTSAIQEHLYANRAALTEEGLIYPEPLCPFPSHGEVSWSLLRDTAPWRDRDYEPDEVITHYRDVCERAGGNIVVISSEDFSYFRRREDIRRLKEAFEEFSPHVFAHIRDPVEYAFSSYHHAVRVGHTTRGFVDFFAQEFRVLGLHAAGCLDRWANVFGSSSIIVRPYAPVTVEGDSVRDFLQALGRGVPCDYQPARVNAGIHPWLVASYRGLPVGAEADKVRAEFLTLSGELPRVDAAAFYLGDAGALSFRGRFGADHDEILKTYARRTL